MKLCTFYEINPDKLKPDKLKSDVTMQAFEACAYGDISPFARYRATEADVKILGRRTKELCIERSNSEHRYMARIPDSDNDHVFVTKQKKANPTTDFAWLQFPHHKISDEFKAELANARRGRWPCESGKLVGPRAPNRFYDFAIKPTTD